MLGVVQDIRELPLRVFQQNGVQFVVCTDNPALCRTSMTEELFRIAKSFNYSIGDIKSLLRGSIEAAFIDDQSKGTIVPKLL